MTSGKIQLNSKKNILIYLLVTVAGTTYIFLAATDMLRLEKVVLQQSSLSNGSAIDSSLNVKYIYLVTNDDHKRRKGGKVKYALNFFKTSMYLF